MPDNGAAAKVDFDLYLITDRSAVLKGGIVSAVEEALEGGARAVQLREKELGGGQILSLARELRVLTKRYDAKLIINDRLDVALLSEADGIHLPASGLGIKAVRREVGPGFLIGISTHSLKEVREAETGGADFVTFGPLYYTASKAGYGEPVGLAALEEVAGAVSIPIFGLGGIKAAQVEEVMEKGAHGVALISYIIADSDPRARTREVAALIKGKKESLK